MGRHCTRPRLAVGSLATSAVGTAMRAGPPLVHVWGERDTRAHVHSMTYRHHKQDTPHPDTYDTGTSSKSRTPQDSSQHAVIAREAPPSWVSTLSAICSRCTITDNTTLRTRRVTQHSQHVTHEHKHDTVGARALAHLTATHEDSVRVAPHRAPSRPTTPVRST